MNSSFEGKWSDNIKSISPKAKSRTPTECMYLWYQLPSSVLRGIMGRTIHISELRGRNGFEKPNFPRGITKSTYQILTS